MKRLKAVTFWLAMASILNADVWVIAPDGYHLLKSDASGKTSLTPAVGITGHQFMGSPDSPVPPPPDPPRPTDDKWGLVALSESEAEKVNDPKHKETAAKVGGAYQEVGRLVQAGKIEEKRLEAVLQMAFNAATGTSKTFWQPWKDKTDDAHNAVNFSNSTDAGQGVIDRGIGASRTSNAAIGVWLKFFLEVLLPWILEYIDSLPASAFEVTA